MTGKPYKYIDVFLSLLNQDLSLVKSVLTAWSQIWEPHVVDTMNTDEPVKAIKDL